MENYESSCIALDFNEMTTINGGNAYDVGHNIGEAIHDFCVGFWDGLTGN